MADRTKKVTLDPEAQFTAKLAEVAAIDTKLVGLKGTAAEWNRKADEAAGLLPIGFTTIDLDTSSLGTLAQLDTFLSNALDEAKQVRKEAGVLWIKANRKDSDETAGLLEQRSKLVATLEALEQLFGEVFEFPSIPKAPSARATSGSTTSASKKGVQFYGTRHDKPELGVKQMTAGHNDLSGLAWYVGGQCGTDSLQEAMRAAGWDGTLTTSQEFGPFEVTTKKGEKRSITVGWAISDAIKTADSEGEPETDEDDKPDED
jgi:hypothetical protein